MTLRDEVLVCARSWLGTPYHHSQSCKGAGADCLGFLLGVYRELYQREPETPPAYTPDWGEIPDTKGVLPELLLDAARRHLVPLPIAKSQPGDVLLFRMHPSAPIKHAAILSAPRQIIHAYSGRGVCLSSLGGWWRKRIAAAFAFPPLEDQ